MADLDLAFRQALAKEKAQQAAGGLDPGFATWSREYEAKLTKAGVSFKRVSQRRTTEAQAGIWEKSGHGKLFAAAPPGQSFHERGLAIDYQFSDPVKAGRIAESMGGTWGGRFKKYDPGHISLGEGKVIKEAKKADIRRQMKQAEAPSRPGLRDILGQVTWGDVGESAVTVGKAAAGGGATVASGGWYRPYQAEMAANPLAAGGGGILGFLPWLLGPGKAATVLAGGAQAPRLAGVFGKLAPRVAQAGGLLAGFGGQAFSTARSEGKSWREATGQGLVQGGLGALFVPAEAVGGAVVGGLARRGRMARGTKASKPFLQKMAKLEREGAFGPIPGRPAQPPMLPPPRKGIPIPPEEFAARPLEPVKPRGALALPKPEPRLQMAEGPTWREAKAKITDRDALIAEFERSLAASRSAARVSAAEPLPPITSTPSLPTKPILGPSGKPILPSAGVSKPAPIKIVEPPPVATPETLPELKPPTPVTLPEIIQRGQKAGKAKAKPPIAPTPKVSEPIAAPSVEKAVPAVEPKVTVPVKATPVPSEWKPRRVTVNIALKDPNAPPTAMPGTEWHPGLTVIGKISAYGEPGLGAQIAHTPSGMRIGYFRTQAEARQVADQLASLTDWTRPASELKANRELQNQVGQVLQGKPISAAPAVEKAIPATAPFVRPMKVGAARKVINEGMNDPVTRPYAKRLLGAKTPEEVVSVVDDATAHAAQAASPRDRLFLHDFVAKVKAIFKNIFTALVPDERGSYSFRKIPGKPTPRKYQLSPEAQIKHGTPSARKQVAEAVSIVASKGRPGKVVLQKLGKPGVELWENLEHVRRRSTVPAASHQIGLSDEILSVKDPVVGADLAERLVRMADEGVESVPNATLRNKEMLSRYRKFEAAVEELQPSDLVVKRGTLATNKKTGKVRVDFKTVPYAEARLENHWYRRTVQPEDVDVDQAFLLGAKYLKNQGAKDPKAVIRDWIEGDQELMRGDLIKQGLAKNEEEAAKILDRMRESMREKHYGSMEYSRVMPSHQGWWGDPIWRKRLGDRAYQKMVGDFLESDIEGRFRRVYAMNYLGYSPTQEGYPLGENLLSQIAKEKGESAHQEARGVMLGQLGVPRWETMGAAESKWLRRLGTVETITSLQTTAAQNVFQGINTVPARGLLKLLPIYGKAILVKAGRRPELARLVRMSGVNPSMVTHSLKSQTMSSGGLARSWLKLIGFQSSEELVRTKAAIDGIELAESMARKLHREPTNPFYRRQLKNYADLTDAEIDEVAKYGKLTDEGKALGGVTMVNETQFPYEYMDAPGWLSHPVARAWQRFKFFSFQQTSFILRHIIEEGRMRVAEAKNIPGPKAKQLAHVASSVYPALSFLAANGVAGEIVNKIRQAINGYESPDSLAKRIVQDEAWVLGLPGDVAQALMGTFDRMSTETRVGGMILGRTLSRVTSAAGAARQVIQKPEKAPSIIGKEITKNISTTLSRRLFPPPVKGGGSTRGIPSYARGRRSSRPSYLRGR